MYKLFILLSVCNAFDDDFSDYWYSNDDGLAGDGDEYSNRFAKNIDGKLEDTFGSITERSFLRSHEHSSKDVDRHEVLELLKKVYDKRKCDSSNKQCAMDELQDGVEFLVNSFPIIGIASNLEAIFDDSKQLDHKIISSIAELSDDDRKLLLKVLMNE